MHELVGAACFAQPWLCFQGVDLELREFLPIEVVQQADDAPELLVFGIEFPREITQRPFERLSVLDVKRLFVVLGEQRECVFARHACL